MRNNLKDLEMVQKRNQKILNDKGERIAEALMEKNDPSDITAEQGTGIAPVPLLILLIL